MTDKTILIDLDSTLVDTLPSWIDTINSKFNVNVYLSDINQWDLSKIPKLSSIPTYKIFDILQEPGFTESLLPMPGAVEAVQSLMANNSVYLVTARQGKNHMFETFPWVKKYLPNFPKSNIIFCPQKHMVQGDVLVDDRPSTMVEYHMWHPNALILGIEYEYNKTLKLEHIPLVKYGPNSWSEIEKKINDFNPELNF